MRIGVNIRFKNPTKWSVDWSRCYLDHIRYAQAVDRLGFDGIWVPEHHNVPSGYNPAPFVALAAVAQATERCAIGTQPLLLPLHHPVMVAEQAAAIDALSGGRMILGVGAGYRDGDFTSLGIDKRDRGHRMEEGLTILTRALREPEPFDFAGMFYTLKGVAVTPRPAQPDGIALQLAARSPAAARRAVRFGLDVNTQNRIAAAAIAPVLNEALVAAGRDPATLGVSVLAHGFLAEDREAARAAALPYMTHDALEFDAWQSADDPDDRRMIAQRQIATEPVLGALTAEEMLGEIAANQSAIRALGFRPAWVNLSLWPPGMPLELAIECLERVAEDILPHVARNERSATQ